MTLRIENVLQPVAERQADEIAVIEGETSLTYRELWLRSDRVAAVLAAAGVQRNDCICLMIPKSADAIAVVLGVLKVGGVYVPLDCSSPAVRLASMVQTCAPCWMVVDSPREPLCKATLDAAGTPMHGAFHVETPFAFGADVARGGRSVADYTEEPGVEDLAYILFTSGSTGQPKGVPIPHRNVVEYAQWANHHFQVKPTDRISAHAPLHFDMSVWDIFGTMAAGAILVLVPPEANLTPGATADFMRRAELTQWYSVPSLLTGMASRDVVQHGDLPTLERLIWGGEAFPVPALRYWMERLPHTEFTNVYGPTEATVNCTSYTVPRPLHESVAHVPIGKPISGRKLRILDDERRELAPEQIGVLYVGGQGLSPGYWRDAAKTAASFAELAPGSGERWYRTGDLARVDAEGVYHFHGRSDRQIKTRGYRIELDEIEAALSRLPQLEQSAIVAVPVGGLEGVRICAAYVPAAGQSCSATELKTALSTMLPLHMIPRRWMPLEEMPTNVNGKVDLARLKELLTDGR